MARTVILLLLTWHLGLSLPGQALLRGTVVDAQTDTTVAYARLFWAHRPATGTISNEEGAFVIEGGNEGDTLVASHINYAPARIAVAGGQPLKVDLAPKERVLAPVSLYGVSGTELMRAVIEALPANHQVEPVVYRAYVRTLSYEANQSAVHLLGDYVFFYAQDKTAGPALAATLAQLGPQKGRIRTYSPAGKADSINGYGMQRAAGFFFDNLFNASHPIFRRNKLKHYQIALAGEVVIENHTFLQVELEAQKEDISSYTLFVEEKTQAIGKLIERKPHGGRYEVIFRESGGKWYLAYSRERYQPVSQPSEVRERIVIYHQVSDPPGGLTLYPGLRVYGLRFEDIEAFLTQWEAAFWDQFPTLPLAGWMHSILNQPSRD